MTCYLILNAWSKLGRDEILDGQAAVHVQAEVLVALAQVCTARCDSLWKGGVNPASLMEPQGAVTQLTNQILPQHPALTLIAVIHSYKQRRLLEIFDFISSLHLKSSIFE